MNTDLSRPRECFLRLFVGDPSPCPRCGSALRQEMVPYMISTRQRGAPADSFVVNNDAGWFCPHCPTLVLNYDEMKRALSFVKPGWNVGNEFLVVGVVNAAAGTSEVPFPVVEFTRVEDQTPWAEPGKSKKRRH